MKTELAATLLAKYGKKNPAQVKSGDTVRVHQRIKEGDKERVQIFEGLVIATKHGSGLDASFTVRKIATNGVGVERTYPLHSPNIVKVERTKSAEVSRSKLYYMRDRLGKAARFKKETRNGMSWDETTVQAIEVVEETAEVEAEQVMVTPEGTIEAEVLEAAAAEEVMPTESEEVVAAVEAATLEQEEEVVTEESVK